MHITTPNKPDTPPNPTNKSLNVLPSDARSGTQYNPIVESAHINTDGELISPAFTAVSPKTIAPTIDNATPIYLGILTLASLSISKIISMQIISSVGLKGIPLIALSTESKNFKGNI